MAFHPSMNVPLTRRQALWSLGGGLGGMALSSLMANELRADTAPVNALLPQPPKVQRVIQLFMNGGVSQMDTFDYKPELERRHGQKFDPGPSEHVEAPTSAPGNLMKCPFEFKQHGESGQWVSSVFPHLAKHVDSMAFLMAHSSKTNIHGPASYMMNTGFLLPGFPCMGSWISYGLGRLCDNLPTFVVLPDARGLPYNQKGNFHSGFLPIMHQGTIIQSHQAEPIADLFPRQSRPFTTGETERATHDLLESMNRRHAEQHQGDHRLDARINAYELAAKMQLAAPEALDLTRETDYTRQSYGLDEPVTTDFGRRCLMARRLLERGVRFVQVWSGASGASNNWDNHTDIINELPAISKQVDRPIAGLLSDLKQRGMLDDTLVIFSTEFGRMPFTQGATGRDHNGGTSVAWLAGAGIKGGTSHGQSDDWSWRAREGQTYCYDLHATILYLLGIDHEKLTYRHNGIDRRLTDVHGHVIHDIIS